MLLLLACAACALPNFEVDPLGMPPEVVEEMLSDTSRARITSVALQCGVREFGLGGSLTADVLGMSAAPVRSRAEITRDSILAARIKRGDEYFIGEVLGDYAPLVELGTYLYRSRVEGSLVDLLDRQYRALKSIARDHPRLVLTALGFFNDYGGKLSRDYESGVPVVVYEWDGTTDGRRAPVGAYLWSVRGDGVRAGGKFLLLR